MKTNTERILDALDQQPDGLDDDELSKASGVRPRQQVTQLCNRLAEQGLVRRASVRKRGKRRKVTNFPVPEEAPGFAMGATPTLSTSFLSTPSLGDEPMSERMQTSDPPRWRKRLAVLSAATDRDEEEMLDEALKDLAKKLLREED